MKKSKSLREHWEKILEKKGLGLEQPLTDNSDGELAGTGSPRRSKGPDAASNTSSDFAQLRRKVDGTDLFMDAHQIKKIRSLEREIPEWAMSDKAVKKLITTSFPSLKKNASARARAGRWVRVIFLYYRMQLPRQIVGRELGLSEVGIKSLIRNISRAAKGLNVRGEVRRHPSRALRGKPGERNEDN